MICKTTCICMYVYVCIITNTRQRALLCMTKRITYPSCIHTTPHICTGSATFTLTPDQWGFQGQVAHIWRGHNAPIRGLSKGSGELTFASTSRDGLAKIWSLAHAKPLVYMSRNKHIYTYIHLHLHTHTHTHAHAHP